MGETLVGIAMLINALIGVWNLIVAHNAKSIAANSALVIKKLETNTDGMAAALATKNLDVIKLTGETEHAKGVIQGEANK